MRISSLRFILVIVLLYPAIIPSGTGSSKIQVAVTTPVKLTDVYGKASNITTGAQRGDAYDALIMHPGFAKKIQAARRAGFRGPVLQYIVADALVGPKGLHSVYARQRTCAQLGINDIQTLLNNINMYRDFCKIHDSIVTRQNLVDLNLDGSGDVAASESWFLHDSSGNRIHRSSGGGTAYFPNPGSAGLQQLFKERLLYELRKNNTEHLFDGIYLDNIALGYGNTDRNSGAPVEYPTEISAGNAVYRFVKYIYYGIKAVDARYLLWANMIGGNNDGSQWDRFSSYLDGGLNEDFSITWSAEVHPAATFYNQLLQAQKWLSDGNAFVGVAQGNGGSNLGKFGLAAYLLIADGYDAYYHYTNYYDMYNDYYDYPEYEAALGSPVENFVITGRSNSGIPVSYKRGFECGEVTLNLSNRTYSISTADSCQSVSPSSRPAGSRLDRYNR